MTIVHIVQFRFKDTASEDEVKKIFSKSLDLKDECMHPTTKQPYILSVMGGKNNSPEGVNKGLTHAFVMTFANKEDRDYYLDEDPPHQAFKAAVKPLIADACVVDFEADVY